MPTQKKQQVVRDPAEQDHLARLLWTAERSLMRFDALASSWPRAATLWRVHAGLAEAAATVDMDGSLASERELLLKLTGMMVDVVDAAGLARAGSVHRILSTIGGPGWNFEEAVPVIAGMNHAELTVDEGTARLERDTIEPGAIYGLAERILNLGRREDIATLPRLLSVAFLLRTAMGGQPLPLAERLLVITADHMWRRPGQHIEEPRIAHSRPARKRRKRSDRVEPYVPTPADARWLVMPSLILGRGIWEPSSPGFLERFLRRSTEWTEREIRRLVALARWSVKLDEFCGKRSTSMRGALADYIANTPVLDAGMFASHAGITTKGAHGVIKDAETAGLVQEVTGRYAYKIYATPMLAQMLREANPERPGTSSVLVSSREFGNPGQADIVPAYSERDDAALDKLLADLADVTTRTARIIAKADDVLKGLEERRRALERYEK